MHYFLNIFDFVKINTLSSQSDGSFSISSFILSLDILSGCSDDKELTILMIKSDSSK